jgi:hypothetical protein
MFYVTGWDDGFIQFRRRDLCAALGASKTELDRAFGELEALCFAMFRIADDHEVAELVALSSPALSGTAEICWWQYYPVVAVLKPLRRGKNSHSFNA